MTSQELIELEELRAKVALLEGRLSSQQTSQIEQTSSSSQPPQMMSSSSSTVEINAIATAVHGDLENSIIRPVSINKPKSPSPPGVLKPSR